MKKNTFFSEKRLVFKETPEQVVSSYETKATEKMKGIETALKEAGKSPRQAADEAALIIMDASGKSADALAKDPSLPQDEKEKYISKINAARDSALKQIEQNMARYEQIAAFVARRTEMEARLKKNQADFEGEIQGRMDIKFLAGLKTAAEGLGNTANEIDAMAAPGMDAEKEALVKKINEQIKTLNEEGAAIRKFHEEQIKKAYGLLDEAAKDMEAARKNPPSYGRPAEFSDARARVIWQQMLYLKSVQRDLAAVSEEMAVMSEAEKRINKIEPLLQWWDEKYMDKFDESYEKRRKAMAKLPEIEANLAKAREEVARVESSPTASGKEKEDARSWLAGAEKAYHNQMAELTSLIQVAQYEKGETEYVEPTPQRYVRIGKTPGGTPALIPEVPAVPGEEVPGEARIASRAPTEEVAPAKEAKPAEAKPEEEAKPKRVAKNKEEGEKAPG